MANGEYSQVMKRMLDILSVVTEIEFSGLSFKGKGKIRSSEVRVEVEEEEDGTLRATKSSSSGKRKLYEHESQNPNDVASSSSSSYPIAYEMGLVVPNEAVREMEQVVRGIEPVREIEPPARRVPVRREAPEWLVNLMREENGFAAKKIFEKELTRTDLNSHQNRLLIPLNQIVEHDFLNEEEKRIILQQHRKVIDKGVDVIFVGSNGQKCDLNLRRWDMKSSSNYVLVSGWFKAAVNNRLRLGQTIHLWSFHSPQRLFFALVPPGPAPVMALPPAPVLAPVPTPDLVLALRSFSANNVPYKRKRTPRVWVQPPDHATRASDQESQSRLEDSDFYELPMCCDQMDRL